MQFSLTSCYEGPRTKCVTICDEKASVVFRPPALAREGDTNRFSSPHPLPWPHGP